MQIPLPLPSQNLGVVLYCIVRRNFYQGGIDFPPVLPAGAERKRPWFNWQYIPQKREDDRKIIG
jgi:hypothetical protein